jgi:hypothetical protein
MAKLLNLLFKGLIVLALLSLVYIYIFPGGWENRGFPSIILYLTALIVAIRLYFDRKFDS